MKSLCLLLLLFFSLPAISQNGTIITGKLLGYDGKPMLKAHVHLLSPEKRKTKLSVQVDANGTYKLHIPEKGALLLHFTGVSHADLKCPLILENSNDLKIDVRLHLLPQMENLDKVKIVGDFNNYDFFSAITLNLQGDSTYTIEMTTDSIQFRYQLMNVVHNRYISGTQSEDYLYDGTHNYRSIVTPQNGKIRIVFDPRVLSRGNSEVELKISGLSELLRKFTELYAKRDTRIETFLLTKSESSKSIYRPSELQQSFIDLRQLLKEKIENEKEPLLRDFYFLDYLYNVDGVFRFGYNAEDTVMILKAFNEVLPSSLVWSYFDPGVFKRVGQQRYAKYLDQLSSTEMAAMSYLGILNDAISKRDYNAYKYLFKRIQEQFHETSEAKSLRDSWPSEVILKAGARIPEFCFRGLDDTTKYFTSESFKGTYLILHFWMVDMSDGLEELKSAFRKYKRDKLEILSVSLEDSRETAMYFRNYLGGMPWLNALVDIKDRNTIFKKYQTLNLPFIFLIDPFGNIVGADVRYEEIRFITE